MGVPESVIDKVSGFSARCRRDALAARRTNNPGDQAVGAGRQTSRTGAIARKMATCNL